MHSPAMVGTVAASGHGVLPTRNPDFGGQRRLVRTVGPLVINVTSGSTFGQSVARFRVRIPSNRLHAIAFLTYEPDATEDTTFPTDPTDPLAWLVAIDAWCRLENGKPTRANNIVGTRVPALAFPTSWESVTGVYEWRGTLTVPGSGSEGAGTGAVAGRAWLTVYWEPAAGETDIPDEELQKLFNSCHAEAGSISTSGTIGGG